MLFFATISQKSPSAYGHRLPVADLENFGGRIIKILSTQPQKFGCLHRN